MNGFVHAQRTTTGVALVFYEDPPNGTVNPAHAVVAAEGGALVPATCFVTDNAGPHPAVVLLDHTAWDTLLADLPKGVSA